MQKGSPKGQKKGIEHRIYLSDEESKEFDVPVVPRNHLKQGKLYDDFCILNQEFLRYIMSITLSKNEYRILMFLLSYMDKRNRIIIDAEMIEYHLKIGASNVNKHIKKLQDNKIIYKRNLGYNKGQEVLINFDVISPHMAFKDKNAFDNVSHHKDEMRKDIPFIKQMNLNGNLDYINPNTGEVFHTKAIKTGYIEDCGI
jgi:predicted transcriptional regulator